MLEVSVTGNAAGCWVLSLCKGSEVPTSSLTRKTCLLIYPRLPPNQAPFALISPVRHWGDPHLTLDLTSVRPTRNFLPWEEGGGANDKLTPVT